MTYIFWENYAENNAPAGVIFNFCFVAVIIVLTVAAVTELTVIVVVVG